MCVALARAPSVSCTTTSITSRLSLRAHESERLLSLLAVEFSHRGAGITTTRRRVLGHRAFDCRDIPRVQRHADDAERLGEPVAAARADERHDVVALRGHPRNRYLSDADGHRFGDLPPGLHQRTVRVGVSVLEAPAIGAEITLRSGVLAPVAADQAARENAVGGDGDAELARGRPGRIFDAARDQRILDLQVPDRMDGSGAPQRPPADLG